MWSKTKKDMQMLGIKKDNYDCGECSCPGYKILIKVGKKNET